MSCLRFSLLMALLSLTACGSQHHSAAKSQVVAKVNDREVTTMQLNQTLQALNPPSLTPEVTQHALSSLVDEELLVQEAQKAQLDRDPMTVAAFEHARRQILAQTFAERRIFPRTQVSLSEEEKYYKDHPPLFEHRKIYRLTAYTIKDPDMTDLMKADLNTAGSSDQVRDVLNEHGIKYEVQLINAPAEDLPLEKIGQFANAKVGDLLIAQQPGNKLLLISIVGLEDKPLSFERAKPTIAAYLTKERNTQAIQDHLKAQRSGASITYVGEFSKFSTARVE
jgi:EpsD family peptidyl-prolyl cis-trans isomerase